MIIKTDSDRRAKMTEEICEHGSQKRKCVICENNDNEFLIYDLNHQIEGFEEHIKLLNNNIEQAVLYLERVKETECSKNNWDFVENAKEFLEPLMGYKYGNIIKNETRR